MFEYLKIDNTLYRIHNYHIVFSLIRLNISKNNGNDRVEMSVPEKWFHSNEKTIKFDGFNIEKIYKDEF